jgi:hypothetical protein
MNVNDICLCNSSFNTPKKISARIIQSADDFSTALSRPFLLITDPRAPNDTRSAM